LKKLAIAEFEAVHAAEAFVLLRQENFEIVRTLAAAPDGPAVRVLLSHPDLPADCARCGSHIPFVAIRWRVEETNGVRVIRISEMQVRNDPAPLARAALAA